MPDGRTPSPTPPDSPPGDEPYVISEKADAVTEKACWVFLAIFWIYLLAQVVRAII